MFRKFIIKKINKKFPTLKVNLSLRENNLQKRSEIWHVWWYVSYEFLYLAPAGQRYTTTYTRDRDTDSVTETTLFAIFVKFL